jgi:hypothetical protein
MESSVAALLLVTASVVLSCIVVVYAVDTIQQSVTGQSQQSQIIENLQARLLNETSILGSTLSDLTNATPGPEPIIP